jgi:DNA-binding response OmpR family regulator
MAVHLLLADRPTGEILPALRVSGLDLKEAPLRTEPSRVAEIAPLVVLVDAADDPAAGFSRLLDLRAALPAVPLVAIVASVDFASHHWAEVADEILTPEAGAAEIDFRLELLRRRAGRSTETEIRLGSLVIDTATFRASIAGRPLELTFKEFELLRFLVSQPGRVFRRDDLLREVWGYGYYGGTRTVDVHIRRLRAKLGVTDEHLIETVRGVGYRATDWAP